MHSGNALRCSVSRSSGAAFIGMHCAVLGITRPTDSNLFFWVVYLIGYLPRGLSEARRPESGGIKRLIRLISGMCAPPSLGRTLFSIYNFVQLPSEIVPKERDLRFRYSKANLFASLQQRQGITRLLKGISHPNVIPNGEVFPLSGSPRHWLVWKLSPSKRWPCQCQPC